MNEAMVEVACRGLRALQHTQKCAGCGEYMKLGTAECAHCDWITCRHCGGSLTEGGPCGHTITGLPSAACQDGFDYWDIESRDLEDRIVAEEPTGLSPEMVALAGKHHLFGDWDRGSSHMFSTTVFLDLCCEAGIDVEGPYLVNPDDYCYWRAFLCAQGERAVMQQIVPLLDRLDQALLPIRDAMIRETREEKEVADV